MKEVTANTVGELMALLATLPPESRLFQRGNIGDYVEGVTLSKRKLAKHKNSDENYYADMTDPVWKKAKSVFLPEFTAIIVSK